MSRGTPAVAAALSLGILLLVVTRGAAVRCYVCSWSPRDHANRTDHCTHSNFDPEKNFADDCPHGCEILAQNDLNGDFEHVRRNCAPPNPPHKGCLTETSRAWTTARCICDSDYCNTAGRITSTSPVVLWVPLGLALAGFLRHRMPT